MPLILLPPATLTVVEMLSTKPGPTILEMMANIRRGQDR
jgi:hypothetical protein